MYIGRWKGLTLKPRGLEDGNPDLIVSRNVDTDVQAVPSDGWYILRKILPPSLSSWPPLSSVHRAIYLLYRLAA